jgi:hypothetical protein
LILSPIKKGLDRSFCADQQERLKSSSAARTPDRRSIHEDAGCDLFSIDGHAILYL